MKKLIVVLLVLPALLPVVKAQTISHHKFKIEFSGGVDPVSSPVAANFTIEPHFRFCEAFALGFRSQLSVSGDFKSEGNSNFRFYNSSCFTADYYVVQQTKINGPQVFIGGGVGGFTESYKSDPDKDNFGFFPRVGLELRRFRTSLEYNATGGAHNYFSINFGVIVGGGNK